MMKIGIDTSDFASMIIIIITSCTSIISGIQGFIYKDSVLRHTQYYKMESVGAIIIGVIGFIGAFIVMCKH